ncbi:alpha/beta fold hydrolase [Streptomyces sp. C11-1]|uniref:Alpha/beta fold hydrolase n=1 Tax=Streptomyces durocortorensis TaxID=2811104 RepID=A0ABY9W038_9ACTN|nr:alpha/beta fold hydrolase [Streptomyces durocortorensis]WNF29160.1 alpha/beta fold hydrolase [Streptomyces durocortorensis]
MDTEASWIRCFHPKPQAAHTLVCFPHAGGSASYYHGLSEVLDPDIEMLVIQYPGRENRLFEEPVSSLHALADSVAEVLPTRLGGARRPVLFGHSMGAIVAFEAARRLEGAGAVIPEALVASACSAPSGHRPERALRADEQPDSEVLARIMGLGGTARGVAEHAELIELVLPAIRADLAALGSYRAADGTTVGCPVTVFVADGDHEVRPADARLWGRHTTAGEPGVHVFEGDHFYLSKRPEGFVDLLQETVRTSRPENSLG